MSIKNKLYQDFFNYKHSYGIIGLISHFLKSKLRRKILFIITTVAMALTFMSYAQNEPEQFVMYGGTLSHYTTICIWASLAFAIIPRIISNIGRSEFFSTYDIPYCFGWFLINFYTLQSIIFVLTDIECSKAYVYSGMSATLTYFLLLLIPLALGDIYPIFSRKSFSHKPLVAVAIGIVLLVVFINVRPDKPKDYWQYAGYEDYMAVTVGNKLRSEESDSQYKITMQFTISNDGEVDVEKIIGKLNATNLSTSQTISRKVDIREALSSGENKTIEQTVRIPKKDEGAQALYEGTANFSYSFEIDEIIFADGVSVNTDYFKNLDGSSATQLYLDGTSYGEEGKNRFYFECTNSDYYRIYLYDAYDINEIEVSYNGDDVDEEQSFKSSRGYAEYYFYSGNKYYITVDADESFSISVERE